ncbi:MAG: tetratricopeptide repeat protein [Candidatus Obscuribacterales bacterium]|nr:tetratricopeptide repeat protein [Candidatus Obscuribacterales bacterium]
MRLLRDYSVRLVAIALIASVVPVVPASASAPIPGSQSVAKLMPLAPQLDYLEPSQAPDSAANNYGDDPESVNEAPDASKSVLQKAVQAYSAGNVQEAASLFQKVLAINPNNGDAHYNLGAIAEQQGNLPEALNHYQAAAKANPQDKDFLEAYQAVASRLQTAKAEAVQQQQRQQAATQQQNQQMKQAALDAKTAFQSGNYDQAIQKLSSISNSNVKDPDVEFGLSQAYKAKSNLGQARYHLTNAMALDPNNETYKRAYASLNQETSCASDQDQVADSSLPPGDIVPMNSGGMGSEEPIGRWKTQDKKRRLVKAVGASAAGAALGALMGGFTNKYDRRGGALRGAVYGGALGLMLGGFSGR